MAKLLQAQLGDIATRARRFFRPAAAISYQVPMELGSHVVLANLDQSPYADEPYRFVMNQGSGSDGVHNPGVGIQARLAAGSEAAVVIDQVWIYGGVAAITATLFLQRNVPYATFNADFPNTPLAGLVLSSPAANPGNALPLNTAAIIANETTLGVLPGSVSLFTFNVGATPAMVLIPLPEPIVLFSGNPALGGPASGDVLQIIGSNIGQGIVVAFWGREYRLLQGAP